MNLKCPKILCSCPLKNRHRPTNKTGIFSVITRCLKHIHTSYASKLSMVAKGCKPLGTCKQAHGTVGCNEELLHAVAQETNRSLVHAASKKLHSHCSTIDMFTEMQHLMCVPFRACPISWQHSAKCTTSIFSTGYSYRTSGTDPSMAAC